MTSAAHLSRRAGKLPATVAVTLTSLFLTAAPTSASADEVSFGRSFAPFSVTPAAPDPATRPHGEAIDIDTLTPRRDARPNLTGDTVGTGTATRTIGRGTASFYGRELAGRPTASGERFNPGALTAAHRTLPFGSMVRVTNISNGDSVIVRINDRGPFSHGRVIDVSHAAAREIGLHRSGTARVKLALLDD